MVGVGAPPLGSLNNPRQVSRPLCTARRPQNPKTPKPQNPYDINNNNTETIILLDAH